MVMVPRAARKIIFEAEDDESLTPDAVADCPKKASTPRFLAKLPSYT